jgi:aspartyl-tRNA(Asn)/glutamyl-tRNA(Gln) amidotransferase subunit C
MKIDRMEVEQVARLARLDVNELDVEKLTSQLNTVLSYIDKLNELDTTGIEPMAHALPLNNVFREDGLKPSLESDRSLANAPEQDGPFFRVPRVI